MSKYFKSLLYVLIASLVAVVSIWWKRNEDHCLRIPLRRVSDTRYVYVDGMVGDHGCLLELNMAGNYEFLLSKRMIESVPFKNAGFAKFGNDEDLEVDEPLYQIPEVTVGNLKIKNAIVRKKEYDFSPDLPSSESNQSYRLGLIGGKIFDHTNLLLDISRQCLYFTKSISVLQKKGYDLHDWLVVPFEKAKSSVKIEVETDLGKRSFIVMAGATHVFLRNADINQEVIQSNKFVIHGVDFGPTEIFSYKIQNACPSDGIIGLSFLENHAIYVDFSRQRLYIQK